MKKKIIPLILVGLALPVIVFGAGLVPCGGKGEPECTGCHLLMLIQNILNLAFQVIIIVAIILLMVSGFNMIFAAGNEKKYASAWKGFTNVLIGVTIMVLAWAIINTVLYIFAPKMPELKQSWYRIKCNPAETQITPQ